MHIRKPSLAARCKMSSSLAVAMGLAAAAALADDLEWKWDVSGHADPSPATCDASISGILPSTVAAANGAETHTHVYDWRDSAGFGFDGHLPGAIMIFR